MQFSTLVRLAGKSRFFQTSGAETTVQAGNRYLINQMAEDLSRLIFCVMNSSASKRRSIFTSLSRIRCLFLKDLKCLDLAFKYVEKDT